MSTHCTEATGELDAKQRATFDAADETLAKSLLRRVWDGSVPILAGVVLFAVACGERHRGGDASRPALAAVALVALGLRRRRSSIGPPDAADGDSAVERGDEQTGDDADARERDDESSVEREW